MSSITIPVKANDHPHLRLLNVLRDLSAVADLIELCFSPTLDNDGQRYISDMRRASHDDSFLRWASHMTETASLPLMGYVWEQDGRIVGNASLIPFRDKGKRVFLVANVATHPEYRRRGIGRALTERVMKQARDKKASAIWLHVRDDNFGAIKLYQELGFQEIARRTTWQASLDAHLAYPDTDIKILPRHAPSGLCNRTGFPPLSRDIELVPLMEHQHPAAGSLEVVLSFVCRFQHQTMGGGSQ
jgi:ribosomal protein S18 acetylase RimI-like enzyme